MLKRFRAAGVDSEADLAELGLAELERLARASNGGAGLALRDWLELAEAWRIARALVEARGNRSAAARALGIGRRTLYWKIEKFGFPRRWNASKHCSSAGQRVPAVATPLPQE